MRRSRTPLALIYLLLIATSCSTEKQIVSTPAADPVPVLDSAPYVCKLIPKQAFLIVSGITTFPIERSSGSKESGTCWAPDTTPKPLQVNWLQVGGGTTQEHLDFLLTGRRNIYNRHGGTPLPSSLGDGMAAYLTDGLLAQQPYRASAKFRCGDKDRLIDIYLTQVAKGRDAMKDLTDLMRIAQNRYAQIHNCKINTT